jgi:RND family efflux transporter MFP subunit
VKKPAGAALVVVLVIAAFAAGVSYSRWHAHNERSAISGEAAKPRGYHCPMHPNFRSDKRGDCGICGMKLVPDEEPGSAATSDGRQILYYQDPHNPNYKSDKPGVNPETGNDLVPAYADDPSAMPPGTIRISPEKQQLIGVKYGVVEANTLGHNIRAFGRVAADETRIARIQTRIEGWVETVFVDFTGKLVKQGQPLLTLYSPEMLATQQEYLLALRSREILKNSSISSLRQDSNGLADAARRRMELWGLSAAQVRQIEETQKPITNITIHSPVSGYVTQKNAFTKQRITPETELYTIVDLSSVWVMADVFENEAGQVRPGQRATITATAYPGRRFPATVSYIQPQIDPQTRTLRVRLELANPDLLLKPDMYVDVDLLTGTKRHLTVPVNAVVNSGVRQTVFVDRGNGYLEPRQVEVGRQFDDQIEVLSGLRAGERIATSGTFLIDSESQLRSAAAGGVSHQHGSAPSGTAESQAVPDTTKPQRRPDQAGAHKHD